MSIKLAVFTNQFPGKVNTFFARDIATLINCGLNIDIFPIYSIQKRNWRHVPLDLKDVIQHRTNIKFLSPLHLCKSNPALASDISTILEQSLKLGIVQFIKSYYVIRQAAVWPKKYDGCYDYMLAYWGNYAATYGYLANKALKHKVPFSFFLHAGTDLYRDQIFLEQKIQFASKVFTVCDFNKRFLQLIYADSFDAFEDKLELHHLGIDLNELQFQTSARDDFTLLAIGSFFPQKGFINALEALSMLASEFEFLKFIFIGDGPEKKNLKKAAKKLGVEERVNFTGFLPFEAVIEFLRTSTILIHPSNGLGDAIPTVIKEALASGLPVIASAIAGIPELIEHEKSGVLVPPNSSNALALAIRDLLLHREKRVQLAWKGRAFAEKYLDMGRNGKQLSRILESDLSDWPRRK